MNFDSGQGYSNPAFMGDKAYRSKVYVQYKDGSKPKGEKVILSFTSGLGGVTKAAYTDRHGVAIIEHASKGRAKVIVRGNTVGYIDAPGETVVIIK